ncbi:hypothetical protein PUN28_018721 [Cardiocondyla obscurior]|uniref:Transmembrane protein n=1 Tax=Cardiocondyla obscurior TaxID=286306 RepID=A0AAW2EDJ0_9HYME
MLSIGHQRSARASLSIRVRSEQATFRKVLESEGTLHWRRARAHSTRWRNISRRYLSFSLFSFPPLSVSDDTTRKMFLDMWHLSKNLSLFRKKKEEERIECSNGRNRGAFLSRLFERTFVGLFFFWVSGLPHLIQIYIYIYIFVYIYIIQRIRYKVEKGIRESGHRVQDRYIESMKNAEK